MQRQDDVTRQVLAFHHYVNAWQPHVTLPSSGEVVELSPAMRSHVRQNASQRRAPWRVLTLDRGVAHSVWP